MEIGTLIRELGGGMWISAEIFILTLLFSLPLGLVVAFGRMSKIAPVRWISKLYISIMAHQGDHLGRPRNPADASVDGSVFRTILSVWNAHFHRIPYDCGADWFCD